ncbi:MAG: glutamate--cysteine ligase [Myxococcota bacterium]
MAGPRAHESLIDEDASENLETIDAPIHFPGCTEPTLGVELELSLINKQTRNLTPQAEFVLEQLNDNSRYTPELFQTIVETNTDVCRTVSEVRQDLNRRLHHIQSICDTLDIACICTGTHPTADWQTLPTTTLPRYENLVASMQWPARRLLICGVHIHVGVKTGEHAIAIMNSMSVYLPHLLALSASSPYWGGVDTGLASSRIKIFEGLPTAGLPPAIRNWNQFVQLMRTLRVAGSIKSIREIWWDIRPHTGFGTLEIRICDGVNTVSETCAIVALVQCLCAYLQDRYDRGEPMPTLRHWTLRENKWRAARFGLDAHFIRNERGIQVPLQQHIRELVQTLTPYSHKLACVDDLEAVHDILRIGPGYQRQRAMYSNTESFEEITDALVTELRTGICWHE